MYYPPRTAHQWQCGSSVHTLLYNNAALVRQAHQCDRVQTLNMSILSQRKCWAEYKLLSCTTQSVFGAFFYKWNVEYSWTTQLYYSVWVIWVLHTQNKRSFHKLLDKYSKWVGVAEKSRMSSHFLLTLSVLRLLCRGTAGIGFTEIWSVQGWGWRGI